MGVAGQTCTLLPFGTLPKDPQGIRGLSVISSIAHPPSDAFPIPYLPGYSVRQDSLREYPH